jgi:hypothetical protein
MIESEFKDADCMLIAPIGAMKERSIIKEKTEILMSSTV